MKLALSRPVFSVSREYLSSLGSGAFRFLSLCLISGFNYFGLASSRVLLAIGERGMYDLPHLQATIQTLVLPPPYNSVSASEYLAGKFFRADGYE